MCFTCHFHLLGGALLPPMTLSLCTLWLKGFSAQISPWGTKEHEHEREYSRWCIGVCIFLQKLTNEGQESHKPNHDGAVMSSGSSTIYISLRLEDLQEV